MCCLCFLKSNILRCSCSTYLAKHKLEFLLPLWHKLVEIVCALLPLRPNTSLGLWCLSGMQIPCIRLRSLISSAEHRFGFAVDDDPARTLCCLLSVHLRAFALLHPGTDFVRSSCYILPASRELAFLHRCNVLPPSRPRALSHDPHDRCSSPAVSCPRWP